MVLIDLKSINSLVKDLNPNDAFNDTLILTFSEFGRRVKQNAAHGVNHTSANNIL